MTKKTQRTDNEKIEILRKYHDGMNAGKTSTVMVNELGVAPSQIHEWKKKFGAQVSQKLPAKVKRKPYVEHIEVEKEPSKIACIIGSPQEIAEVLKGMR